MISARALEFTILTASRTGEVINASWDEIDMRAKAWTIPAKRMKSGKEHKVPLTNRALEILSSLPRESDFVFSGGGKGKPLRNVAMLDVLKAMRSGLSVHGFRSSFRDWAAEQTNHPREAAEAALAHTIPNAVERAYRAWRSVRAAAQVDG